MHTIRTATLASLLAATSGAHASTQTVLSLNGYLDGMNVKGATVDPALPPPTFAPTLTPTTPPPRAALPS